MPRIGGKPKAKKDVPVQTVSERFAPPGEINPFNELAQSSEESRQKTVDSLIKSKKRVWNTKGRLKRAKFMAECEALRLEGFTPAHTADVLGCSVQQVHYQLLKMRRDSDMPSQLKRLDDVGIPLAVDNALNGIKDGDKEYTLRLLDGRGVFRTHKSIDAQVTQKVLMMTINVVDARTIEGAPARPGSIVGAPETFDTTCVPTQPMLPVTSTPAPDPASVGIAGPLDLS